MNIPCGAKDHFLARIHRIYNISIIYPHYFFFFHRMNKEKNGLLTQIAQKAQILGLFLWTILGLKSGLKAHFFVHSLELFTRSNEPLHKTITKSVPYNPFADHLSPTFLSLRSNYSHGHMTAYYTKPSPKVSHTIRLQFTFCPFFCPFARTVYTVIQPC